MDFILIYKYLSEHGLVLKHFRNFICIFCLKICFNYPRPAYWLVAMPFVYACNICRWSLLKILKCLTFIWLQKIYIYIIKELFLKHNLLAATSLFLFSFCSYVYPGVLCCVSVCFVISFCLSLFYTCEKLLPPLLWRKVSAAYCY